MQVVSAYSFSVIGGATTGSGSRDRSALRASIAASASPFDGAWPRARRFTPSSPTYVKQNSNRSRPLPLHLASAHGPDFRIIV
jgi:hypothetical protein